MSLIVGISPEAALGASSLIETVHRDVDYTGLSASDLDAVTNRFRTMADPSKERASGVFGAIRFPWQTTPPPPSSGAGTTSETPPPEERNFFQRIADTIRVPTSVADFTGSQGDKKTVSINPASPVTLAIAGAAALGAYLVFRK